MIVFADQYPDSRSALAHWYSLAERHDFSSFADLRKVFPVADQVGKLTVFNVGGNKVRLGLVINLATARSARSSVRTADPTGNTVTCRVRCADQPRPAGTMIKANSTNPGQPSYLIPRQTRVGAGLKPALRPVWSRRPHPVQTLIF